MTFLIDTNVFLELLLGGRKADDCERFLEGVSVGETEAVVTTFSIHAVEAVLNDPKFILAFIRNTVNSVGLRVYNTNLEDEMSAAMLMEHVNLDFDDSIQYYVAKKLGSKGIVSYDRHFDNLDLPRIEPAQILSG